MDVPHLFRRQSGVTLIETLVAMAVLSIGLLGIAGLHVLSMQTGISALNRTRAIQLSQDVLERMLANRAAVGNYNWGGMAAAATPVVVLPASACTDAAAACAPDALATDDRTRWQALLQHRDFGLPSGSAQINVVPRAGFGSIFDVSITIGWVERNENLSYTVNAIVNTEI